MNPLKLDISRGIQRDPPPIRWIGLKGLFALFLFGGPWLSVHPTAAGIASIILGVLSLVYLVRLAEDYRRSACWSWLRFGIHGRRATSQIGVEHVLEAIATGLVLIGFGVLVIALEYCG